MNSKICIIGYGSIGHRHHRILKKYVDSRNIYIITKRTNIKNSYKNLEQLKKILPKYIFVTNETVNHFNVVKYIEKNLNGTSVLVEKPLFEKYRNFKPKKNKYYVAYNMRFNPILNFIKEKIRDQKIYTAKIICGAYLPSWRKNRDYKKIYSSIKQLGGGVLLDLSHEIDYAKWIFGKYNLLFSSNKKMSNLKINVEDYSEIFAKTNSGIFINISLNYFSRLPIRLIIIEGKNLSIQADLFNKKVKYLINSRYYKKRFNFEQNFTYDLQIKSFLKNKFNLCTIKEALSIMKIIDALKLGL